MRVLGVDLVREPPPSGPVEHTLVLLDEAGRIAAVERPSSVPAIVAAVSQLVGDDPFLLGVDVPVVVPARTTRPRAVESLLRRRLGIRLPQTSRAAQPGTPPRLAGDALLAGFASAGLPCLAYPDRDRRTNGLAETYPDLTIKALLWESSVLAQREPRREEILRAIALPAYRVARMPARSHWADQAAALELALRVLGAGSGFDLAPATEALARAESVADTERAAALLDAALIAGTTRRYLEAPESTMFVGDHEHGYVILPADGTIRRLLLGDPRSRHGHLFPRTSIQERLGPEASVHSPDLLSLPGQPQRLEASFAREPRYEFDNVDEMMWWKHCRHTSGPSLPIEGLTELQVVLDAQREDDATPLRLVRSRHRTISFRFEPPKTWRARLPTRDGRTYAFRVVRAVYETLPGRHGAP